MALVKCPDCGKEVSDQAPTCPNCGRPMAAQPPPPGQQQAVRRTTLTRPAGCFLQVISPFIVLFGLFLLAGLQERRIAQGIFGVILLVFGVWLFIQGGKPARQK